MAFELLWVIVLTILAFGEGMNSYSSSEVCNSIDLKGLTSFRSGVQADSSGRLENWVGLNCCSWDGVGCDSMTGRVTELRLPGLISTDGLFYQSQMDGLLSSSITLLSSLEVIDLGGLIGIGGTIPASIGFRLPKLRKLILCTNNLTGPIPDSIGKLPDLEELDLSNNSLVGRIPISFTNLKSISVLYLDTNFLEGPISFPSSSGQMPSLRFLGLHDNLLYGTIPFMFGTLVSLRRVSLANNQLKGAIPSSLGNLSALSELYLQQNRLSGRMPKSISLLSQLILLNVSNNLIRGPLPREMSSLRNVQTLDLSFNRLNLSSIPRWIVKLPSLSRIHLAGCGIQGRIPQFLKSTPSQIQELDLSDNYLSGSIPTWLGSLTQLYSLNLSRNSLASTIPESITNLHELGVLDLHSNKLTGSISQVFEIGQRFPGGSLTYIDLSNNRFSAGIEQIGAEAQTGIQFLNLSNNILKGGVPTSIGRLNALQSLDLNSNKLGFNLPDDLADLSSLQILKLQKNQFTGRIPKGFLKLRQLKEMDLSYNLLVGEIPEGKPLSDFPVSCYSGNKGLCGKPLTPCTLWNHFG